MKFPSSSSRGWGGKYGPHRFSLDCDLAVRLFGAWRVHPQDGKKTMKNQGFMTDIKIWSIRWYFHSEIFCFLMSKPGFSLGWMLLGLHLKIAINNECVPIKLGITTLSKLQVFRTLLFLDIWVLQKVRYFGRASKSLIVSNTIESIEQNPPESIPNKKPFGMSITYWIIHLSHDSSWWRRLYYILQSPPKKSRAERFFGWRVVGSVGVLFFSFTSPNYGKTLMVLRTHDGSI